VYEPGSVFKLITMAAALDTGYLTPDSRFTDDGVIEVAHEVIRNAEEKVYGDVSAREALAYSINVVSARISLDLGADFYMYVRRFGIGKVTEVDLSVESEGIVKEPGTTNWSISDQATNSYGQGISVTGLQMINSVAAIANKGVLLQPQVVQSLVKDGKVYKIPPRVTGRPVSPATAQQLTEMMVYTVQKSSYAGMLPGYELAGKTGTADIPTSEGYTLPETITSFIGFLPADDPQLVIMVRLDKIRPSDSPEPEVEP
jgi:cell division protein FtsI/penicillin-binding protein 2